MPIKVTFLRDTDSGGNAAQPARIADQLAGFISNATASLHLAIYDFRLGATLGAPVVDAIRTRAAAGAEVQIAYDAGKPAGDANTGALFAMLGADPAPLGTSDFLHSVFDGTTVQLKAIHGTKLMHNKYVVRDVNTAVASVWTGSTNFTDDAWTYQENNIITVDSPELATFYENDFKDLWVSGDIKGTGTNDSGQVNVGSTAVGVDFSPGDGPQVDQAIASLISTAKTRIKIASMIISSRGITAALDDALSSGQVRVFAGIFDATQMDQVLQNWRAAGRDDLVDNFKVVASSLVGKHSIPYTPAGKHNFLHDKLVVCDDAVVTGSFNFSKSATQNAENVLVIKDSGIADMFSDYVDALVAQYRT
jgi:phosphatidylserine/phosphatidylglycerophosphate/cardiolipin synthase-like enzyme